MEQKPISDISFREFLKMEKLMGSRCKKCGALYCPPRPICVECSGTDLEWVEFKGRGSLVSFTCIHVGPPWTLEEGYSRERPYVVGLVELEEGPRVVARLEGVDGTKPETIKLGMPLKVKFLHRGEGESARTLLAFEPAS